MSSQDLKFPAEITTYSCTCTMEGCGWFSGGYARNQKEADQKARLILSAHLREKHGIVKPRIKPA